MLGIDVGRVERLLNEMEEALEVIGEAIGVDEDEFLRDLRSIYAVRYSIVRIVEAASLLGSHILEVEFGVSTETYTEVFKHLARRGILSQAVAQGFRALVGLRNLLVHRYWDVDDARLYREAKRSGLGIIRGFIDEIRRYLKARARENP